MSHELAQSPQSTLKPFDVAARPAFNAGTEGLHHEGLIAVYDEVYSFVAKTYSPGQAMVRTQQGPLGTKRKTKEDELAALLPGTWIQELHVYDDNHKLVLHFGKGIDEKTRKEGPQWFIKPSTWDHHRLIDNFSRNFKREQNSRQPPFHYEVA